MHKITGIILAGGKSSRMGTDKAFLDFNGKTLLENAVNICNPFCDSIVISSNKKVPLVENYALISDEFSNCGPMGGIYSAIKKSGTDWNFVLSVDSPFVKPEFVKSLFSETEGVNAIIPVHSKGKEPLIAFYHKQVLPVLENRIKTGDYKLHNLFASIKPKFVDSQYWIEKHPKLFHNINRPEDL